MQEKKAQLLGQEDPLEEEKAIYSIILAWRIPRTEEPTYYYSSWDLTEQLIQQQQQQQQGYTQQNLGNKKFYRKKKFQKKRGEATDT